ncbi:winged helix-turn-helix transcriptional regulator [candidate division KSB1 bacterium]
MTEFSNNNNFKEINQTVLQLRENYLKSGFTHDTAERFRSIVYSYFRNYGRGLPWRYSSNPYHIFVSEVMLQQTQVERVIPKFRSFIEKFPDFPALASSAFHEVMDVWQGLGYNRRALSLHNSAKIITDAYGGKLPQEIEQLKELPGIGYATACEITAFAFNKPCVFIETNIRSLYIHIFFPEREKVSDREILPLIERTLDHENPREWYYALMDFGVFVKKEFGNSGRKSSHYKKQGQFKGSNREIRGLILKTLMRKSGLKPRDIAGATGKDAEKIRQNLEALCREGLVRESDSLYRIA